MKLPLAVYTANHGLEWRFPQTEISLSELERVRRSLGRLPDFDAGDSGFVGIRVETTRVFVEKVQSVRAWDFRGRDATYLTMTWFDRDVLSKGLIASILMTDEFVTPSRNVQGHFNLRISESNSICRPIALNWIDEAFDLIRDVADKSLRINDIGKVVAFENKRDDFCPKCSDGVREERRINQEASNSSSCQKGYDIRNIVLMTMSLMALLVATNLFIRVVNRSEENDSVGSTLDGKIAIVQVLATNDVSYSIVGDNLCSDPDIIATNDLRYGIGWECYGCEVCATNAMETVSTKSNEIEPTKQQDCDSCAYQAQEMCDVTDDSQKETGLTNMLMKGDQK